MYSEDVDLAVFGDAFELVTVKDTCAWVLFSRKVRVRRRRRKDFILDISFKI